MLTKNVKQPVPAVDFANSIACVDGLFNQEQNMHVTPTEYLSTENFLQTRSKHTTRRETKAWPGGPNMKYWPQQLNFALWCATTSCGVPRDICCRQMYHSNVDPLVLHWYICNDVEKADQWYIQNGKKKHQALISGQTDHQFSFPLDNELDMFGMTIYNRLNFDRHISILFVTI